MKERKMRRCAALLLAAVAAAGVLSPQVGAIAGLPDAMVLQTGGVASVEVALPLSAEVSDNAVIASVGQDGASSLSLTAGDETGTADGGAAESAGAGRPVAGRGAGNGRADGRRLV